MRKLNHIIDTNSVSEDNGDRDGARNARSGNSMARRRRARQCFNKYCQTDPNNASLWSKTKIENNFVCKMCEEGWKREQFCYFCKQIYVDNDVYCADDRSWIDCDHCGRWVCISLLLFTDSHEQTHIECEELVVQKQINDSQERGEDSCPYSCPSCRAKGKGATGIRRNTPNPNANSAGGIILIPTQPG